MVTRRRPSSPGRTPPAPTSVYRRGREHSGRAPPALAAGRARPAWFDIGLATALLLPVIAVPARGSRSTWTVLCVVQIVPLYWRRRHPIEVFVAVRGRERGPVAARRHAAVGPGRLPGRRRTPWRAGAARGGGSARSPSGSPALPSRPSTGCAGRRAGHRRQHAVVLPDHRRRSWSPRGRSARSAASAARTSTRWSSAASGSSARPRSRWSWRRRTSGPGSPARCTTSSPTACR